MQVLVVFQCIVGHQDHAWPSPMHFAITSSETTKDKQKEEMFSNVSQLRYFLNSLTAGKAKGSACNALKTSSNILVLANERKMNKMCILLQHSHLVAETLSQPQ